MDRLTLRTPLQRIATLLLLGLAVVASLRLLPQSEVDAGKDLVLEDFSGQVVGVIDGDTLDVMHNGRAERVRLHGIDCPEQGQPFGQAAKKEASRLAFGQTVTVNMLDVDRYGRTVGEVRLPNGQSLNREMVRAGLAWWYRKYAPQDPELAKLEDEARKDRRGLWSDKEPVAPWEWRRR